MKEAIKLETAEHEARLTGLEQAVGAAEEKLGRVRYLIAHDAEPRVRELEAAAALDKAEQAILEENTRWTSQLAQLESQVQDANLTIARAEKEQQLEIPRQHTATISISTVSAWA